MRDATWNSASADNHVAIPSFAVLCPFMLVFFSILSLYYFFCELLPSRPPIIRPRSFARYPFRIILRSRLHLSLSILPFLFFR